MEMEKLNKSIKKCKRCRLFKTRTNVLCGEGNILARIMLIAQAPGKNEDKEGRMFIGPSGKVLDELLNSAKITRSDIYMTNLIKCMLPKNRRPKQDEIESCSYYLTKEIDLINPEILVPLGYYATRYIFKRYAMPLPGKKEFFELCGKLFWTGDKKIFPLPHPATVLYDPSRREDLLKKYRKLKILSTECKWYLVCPMKKFYEHGDLDRKWIELYCKGDWENCVRYQMEEKGIFHPDWMLPNGTEDENLKN
ncbi:uracil-DNA glycosylase [Desulfothermus okinawensis]